METELIFESRYFLAGLEDSAVVFEDIHMLNGVARAKRDALERIVGNNDMDAGSLLYELIHAVEQSAAAG